MLLGSFFSGYFFFSKDVKFSAIFYSSTKKNANSSPGPPRYLPISGVYPVVLMSFYRISQTSSKFGQQKLAMNKRRNILYE